MGIVLLLMLVASFASGQKVMSSRAGMIYYSESSVTVDGKQIRAGALDRRPQLQDGQTFSSVRGHAEILMGPGATLWTNQGAQVRFDDTSADQPEVTLLAGGVILEVKNPVSGTRLRVRVGETVAEFSREGVYRFDFSPSRVRVYAGETQVGDSRVLRGQEWANSAARTFDRKDRDDFIYFAAYRSLQLESEAGPFRQWRQSSFTERSHSGFGIDFPGAAGSARVKYLAGGESGLVYHLEGNAITGGRAPLVTNRLPFKLGVDNFIRTETGRVEVFLGVGLVARLAENSQLRMMDTTPVHPVIAIDRGTASIEVTSSSDEPHLRVRVGDSTTELVKPGVYRFDAGTGSLQIYGGEATAQVSDVTVRGRQAQQINLKEPGSAAKFDASQWDTLMKWTADRSFVLYQSPAAFMTAWEPMMEPGKVRHKYFGERIDRRPQAFRRRRPQL